MQTKSLKAFGRGRAMIALLAASTACLAIPAQAQEAATAAAATPHAKIGAWGFDLEGRDLSVKPGDDFDHYASGIWLKTATIGADKPEVSAFYNLYDESQSQLKDLITNAPADSKYGALYKSMMDEGRIEALGIAPLKPDLARIAAIKTKAEMAHYMGTTDGHFGGSLFGFSCPAGHRGRVDQPAQPAPGRARHARPRLLSQRRVQAAARGLSRLCRAHIPQTIGTPNPAAAADR